MPASLPLNRLISPKNAGFLSVTVNDSQHDWAMQLLKALGLPNSGRPFAITLVEVGATTKEIEKLLGAATAATSAAAPAAAPAGNGFFGAETVEAPVANATTGKLGAAATPAEDKRPLALPRKPSAFVVQVDYLSIPEEKPASSPEGEPKK